MLGFGLGAPEIIIIVLIILLLFGSTQLPKLARSLGQASKELKKGMEDGAAEDEPAKSSEDKMTIENPKDAEQGAG